ncbi:MAG: sulfite exporter TauE/SafE family protein [Cyclobacteriaceae bacterium]
MLSSILTDITSQQWALLIICGMLIGISKTGIAGAGIMVIPVLAGIFGGRASTGILLPMLVVADIFAVWYYNRHAQWKYLIRLLPWTLAGIAVGVWVGDVVSDTAFRTMMAVIIFICLGLMVWQDLRRQKIKVPEAWWFSAIIGLAGGFATMIGNAAGPIMAVYLLSMHLPKNHYIGTGAWFFLIINVLKLPLHIGIWHTITYDSLMLNASMIPAIALGTGVGIFTIRKIPERAYRLFIIATTGISAFLLF